MYLSRNTYNQNTLCHSLIVISFCDAEFTGKPLKQKPLLNALNPVTAQWRSFGIQLGVDSDKLKEFEDFTRNVKYYLSETLQIWLKQNDPPPTVQNLPMRFASASSFFSAIAADCMTQPFDRILNYVVECACVVPAHSSLAAGRP